MKTYTMQKINIVPDWDAIPVMPIDNFLWLDPVDVTAQAQICWDDEAFYVRMKALEPKLRMQESGLVPEVCRDSCFEFFFQPTDRPEYMNFEMNPDCSVWLGYGVDGEKRMRLLIPKVDTLLSARGTFTFDGWRLTYKIPFSFLRIFYPEFAPKEGMCIRGNIYKCGERTTTPHFMAWNPIVSKKPNFHLPEFFGNLVFGGLQETDTTPCDKT